MHRITSFFSTVGGGGDSRGSFPRNKKALSMFRVVFSLEPFQGPAIPDKPKKCVPRAAPWKNSIMLSLFRSRCPGLYPGSLRMPIESIPWKFLLPSTRGRPREPCLVKMITSTSWGMIRTQLNLTNNTITSLGENNIGIHVPETSEYYRTFASPVFRCS